MGKALVGFGLLAVLSAAGCASGTSDAASTALTGTAFGPKAAEPKDFVVATRPATLEYLPVGVTPPQRSIRPKTPAELEAEKAALAGESQRAASNAAAVGAAGSRVKAAQPRPPIVN
ncbi:MAG: hypothetical protein ACRCXM_17275 [Beijerinckiaceae bacterium]